MIKVSDYIARRLYELGCRHVFMVTGGGAMHLNDAFASRKSPYQVLFEHHEQACAIAAEGLYRASRNVAVVNVTTGPGGLNALTGVMGQWTDSIPAIYVSGQVKQSTTVGSCRGLGLRQLGDQEVDIIPIVRPISKYAVSIRDAQSVRHEVEKAFHLACSGRMGPVWIDVPMDVQVAMVEESALVPYVPEPESSSASELGPVLSLIHASERPAIVVGHGVRLAQQGQAVLELLQQLPVPVLTTFGGCDLIADDHPCYAGRIGTQGTRGGNYTLQNADLVLMLGTRNNIRQVSYNWESFARHAKTICVDIDEAELRKPTFRPTVPVHADVADFLRELRDALAARPVAGDFGDWLRWARERTARYPAVRPEHLLPMERIHPYPFFERFTRQLAEDSVVIAGNGTASVGLFQAAVVRGTQRYIWNSGCASMGFDLPAAIGAAVGLGRDVWCVAGDGSLQMNLQELSTVVFHQMPIKLVVLENGGYASIRQTQENFFGEQYGCGPSSGVGFPSMQRLADAYGLPYVCSTRLEDVAADQQLVTQTGGPVLWEVKLTLDYVFEPKVASRRLEDGRMVSSDLEDMAPFLPRGEHLGNMLVSD